MKLFSAQVQNQSQSIAIEGQVNRAQNSLSRQALKASDSVKDRFSLVQPESESKSPSSVQFKTSVPVSSSSSQSSHCTLAISRSSI